MQVAHNEYLSPGPSHFSLKGHGYFFSDDEAEFSGLKVDWLGGRNICRRFCMDLLSIETPKENDLIKDLITTRESPQHTSSEISWPRQKFRNELKLRNVPHFYFHFY